MLLARSVPEARIYMAIVPCACSFRGFDAPSRLVAEGEGLAVEASGYCPSCGAERRFRIALGDERVPPGELGNAAASVLIDAGQWLAIADDRSARVPANLDGLDPDRKRRARADLGEAIAALREVLKFIPVGEDTVPRSAFFTAEGKRVALADPRRLSRIRLEAVFEAWTSLAAQYAVE